MCCSLGGIRWIFLFFYSTAALKFTAVTNVKEAGLRRIREEASRRNHGQFFWLCGRGGEIYSFYSAATLRPSQYGVFYIMAIKVVLGE